jgi:uncharacterized protein
MRDYLTTIPLQVSLAIVVLSITYLIQRFWFMRAWRLIERVSRPTSRTLLRSLLFVAASAVFITVLDSALGHIVPRDRIVAHIVVATKLWLSLSFLAVLSIKAVSASHWILKRISAVTTPGNRRRLDSSRRAFIRYATMAAGGFPFAAGTYGFLNERLDFQTRAIQIPMAHLPRELDGLRIIHLSDIHMGDFMPRTAVRRAVEMANDLRADLAVVTGDFITDVNDPLEECIAELSRLHAPLGVWGCNGNHEVYANVEAVAQQLFERYGMRLLRQENAEIEWRGGRFNVIGVDYQRQPIPYGAKPPMLQGIEPHIRKDIPNVLLSHNPNSFRRAAELGVELSLAGHTHGGQVRVEIIDHSWCPAHFMTDFVAGLYRYPFTTDPNTSSTILAEEHTKQAVLYVNRGIGTIGMPVRLGVPPEITLITLRTAG